MADEEVPLVEPEAMVLTVVAAAEEPAATEVMGLALVKAAENAPVAEN